MNEHPKQRTAPLVAEAFPLAGPTTHLQTWYYLQPSESGVPSDHLVTWGPYESEGEALAHLMRFPRNEHYILIKEFVVWEHGDE